MKLLDAKTKKVVSDKAFTEENYKYWLKWTTKEYRDKFIIKNNKQNENTT